ncbi:CRISPR-associated protein Cas9 [Spiroplasma helicoides]|uniref:CRISPR-associated endonuclease Cas9 n=1 Tax=Spiroplasma helicoides TaxID=216938 RepID=A0A1B3SLT6_9MOLU|nr:type II CRISPR RNA-guided endonuclease Cas9 [Spiroplasma helicoides]AOG60899.1 CRISPR-associated protein Cas9 [Spiroplasma helicoides]
MKKVNIGLDIGIASVGWSIYDIENKKIVKAGSRLFSEANAGTSKTSTTSDRREQRGRRRNLRRALRRRMDLIKLFVDFKYINSQQDFYQLDFNFNYLEKRNQALNEQISRDELLVLLFNFIKKRGSFNYKDDILEMKEEKKEEIDISKITDKKDKLPVEIQLDNYKLYGKYRGINTEDSLIAHEWYKREIEKILETQVKFNVVDKDFCEKYLELFDRKRQYFDGPGWTTSSKTQKSKYGWKDEKEFFERLSGYDTYDSKEKRAPKHSMTSYLFNILNDLNNLKIEGLSSGLTYEQKYEIINSVIEHKEVKNKNINLKQIAKIAKVDVSGITGYRIKKNNTPDFTNFEFINKLRAASIKANLDYSFIKLDNIKVLDQIAKILTVYQTAESRKEQILKIKDIEFDQNQAEVISLLSFTGTHSLSIKTMNKAIEDMWYENKNHMQVFSEKGIKPDYNIKIEGKFTRLPVLRNKISEMYISPVVKRALIESIKIIKEIEKMNDLEIKDIVIELARESNSEDRKKYIADIQKKNAKENSEIEEKYKKTVSKVDIKTKTKLILFNEQDGKCVYSGKSIDVDRLLSEPNYCEIDHIIPFSVSFDDSRSNKVLVLREENQNKKQNTPWQYFKEINRNWDEYKARVYNLYVTNKKFGKYGTRKYENLVFEKNINDEEIQFSFINRNLNDTRYATSEVKNYLTFFKKELNKSYSIKTINGGFTNYIRNKFLHLGKKDRDDYKHHAVDATICAIAPIIDIKDGKTLSMLEKDLNSDQVIKKDQLVSIIQDISTHQYNFSRKVEKRTNKQMFNETIYSTRVTKEGLHKIVRIDILSTEPSDIKNLKELFTKDQHKLLIYNSDKKTYEYLQKIFDTYVNDVDKENKPIKNPFYHFTYELNEKIVKQSNEENPPIVRYLKYDKGIINQFTKITHKYKNVKQNKEVVVVGSNALGYDLFYSKTLNMYKILPVTHKVAYYDTSNSDNKIKYRENDYEIEKAKFKIDSTYIKKYTIFKYNELNFDYKGENMTLLVTGFNSNSESLEFCYLEKAKEPNKRIYKAIKQMKNIKLITSNSTRTKIKIID